MSPINRGEGGLGQRQTKHLAIVDGIKRIERSIDRIDLLRTKINGEDNPNKADPSLTPITKAPILLPMCLNEFLNETPDKLAKMSEELNSLITDIEGMLF